MYSLNSELKKIGDRSVYDDFPALNENYSANGFGGETMSHEYTPGALEMQNGLLDDNKDKKKKKTTGTVTDGSNFSSGIDGNYRPLTAVEMNETLRANSPLNNLTRHISPVATPYRLPALYAQSQKGLDDFAKEYFDQEMRPLYDTNRKNMEERVKGSIINYKHLPDYSLMHAMNAYDPMKAIDETMAGIDEEKLRLMVAPLARDSGYDVDTYMNEFVKPTLRNHMINEAVEDGKPKSSSEYIIKSSLNNSVLGKLVNSGFRNKSQLSFENEGLARHDANIIERVLSGVGGLLIDAPLFSGLGAFSSMIVGRTTSMFANRLANKVYSYAAAEGMSKQYAFRLAERAIIENLGVRMAQSSAMQGLTLGNYDVAHSVVDDILYNGEIDVSKAFKSFAGGGLTGLLLGTTGTAMRKYFGGLTGGRKVAASAGVLSAESAIFTATAEAEKMLHGVDIEPIDLFKDFTESAATLGIMKMTHWRPKGATEKLKSDGTLRDELKLSNSQQAELRELNIEPREFMQMIEMELNLPTYGAGSVNQGVYDKYLKLMSSDQLSASTKSKLMYLIENKVTSTPPVAFDYSVEQSNSGHWSFTTYDFEGNRIERVIFNHAGNVKDHLLVERSKIRQNRIAAYERELLQGLDSQNFLRQAGLYAKENNLDVNDVAAILYKRAQKEQLTPEESGVVDEIIRRTSYNETGMVKVLADARRAIEKKHGLAEGALLAKVDKPFYMSNKAENEALDDYLSFVQGEVELLKQGAKTERAAEVENLAAESPFKGMSNDEVKRREIEDYYSNHPEVADAVGSGNFKDKPIEIDDEADADYVWSYDGVDNTKEDIANFRSYAQELGRKYNCEIEFIENERELPYPDKENPYEVADYNNRVRALGWMDRSGRITLNLPNIPSYEEVEKTVVHEAVAHSGFSKLFGNHLNTFLEDIYRKAAGDVRAGIDKVNSQYSHIGDKYLVIEEYLAHLTEKAVVTPKERSLLADFKKFIKDSLVRFNVYTGRNRRIRESDLISLIRQHAKYIRKRTDPSKYRSRLFGDLSSSRQNEETYYDREAYANDVRARIADGSFMRNTPAALYDSKAFRHYELFPSEMQERFQKRWNETDERIREVKGDDHYRFIGEKGADNLAYYEGIDDGDPYLKIAKELYKEGIMPYYIKKLTGWERGADRQWRKEIPDDGMVVNDRFHSMLKSVNPGLGRLYEDIKSKPINNWGTRERVAWELIRKENVKFPENTNLGDILHDPRFFAAYPELSELPVKLVDNPDVPFRYDNVNKNILLDKSFFIYSDNSIYMSGLLQNVIQDYEGFSKAVSMNLMGINTRVGKQYASAMNVIRGLNDARNVIPSFDEQGKIDEVFKNEYGFTPEEFLRRFPSLDEYLIYKLTGKNFAFSGDVEMRNAMRRHKGYFPTMDDSFFSETEDMPRSKQVPVMKVADLKRFFNGPLDIIYQRLKRQNSDAPLEIMYTGKRPRRTDFLPSEENSWNPDEFLSKVVHRVLHPQKEDFGYREYKKRKVQEYKEMQEKRKMEELKRIKKKPKTEFERNIEYLKSRFPGFEYDPDNLN